MPGFNANQVMITQVNDAVGSSASRARWSIDGQTLLDQPAVGDLVAVHWDWVCDVLTPEEAARIEGFEHAQLAAIGLL